MNIIEQVIEYLDDNQQHLDRAIEDDKKANEVWYNSGDLPFTNHCFDLRSAILDEFISVFSAVKNFNFTLEKDDPDYMLLREEYDYAKHVLAIPREKRNNFYTWKYDAANILNN